VITHSHLNEISAELQLITIVFRQFFESFTENKYPLGCQKAWIFFIIK